MAKRIKSPERTALRNRLRQLYRDQDAHLKQYRRLNGVLVALIEDTRKQLGEIDPSAIGPDYTPPAPAFKPAKGRKS